MECIPILNKISSQRSMKLHRVPRQEHILSRLLGCDPIIFIGNDCGIIEPHKKIDTGIQGMHRWTNLPIEGQNGEWRISLHTINRNIYLRFADEISILTSHDYISGAQWIKKAARTDFYKLKLITYDIMSTGFCQFNSAIKPLKSLISKKHISINLPYYKMNQTQHRISDTRKQPTEIYWECKTRRNSTITFYQAIQLHSWINRHGDQRFKTPIGKRYAAAHQKHKEFLLEEIDAALSEAT